MFFWKFGEDSSLDVYLVEERKRKRMGVVPCAGLAEVQRNCRPKWPVSGFRNRGVEGERREKVRNDLIGQIRF